MFILREHTIKIEKKKTTNVHGNHLIIKQDNFFISKHNNFFLMKLF